MLYHQSTSRGCLVVQPAVHPCMAGCKKFTLKKPGPKCASWPFWLTAIVADWIDSTLAGGHPRVSSWLAVGIPLRYKECSRIMLDANGRSKTRSGHWIYQRLPGPVIGLARRQDTGSLPDKDRKPVGCQGGTMYIVGKLKKNPGNRWGFRVYTTWKDGSYTYEQVLVLAS